LIDELFLNFELNRYKKDGQDLVSKINRKKKISNMAPEDRSSYEKVETPKKKIRIDSNEKKTSNQVNESTHSSLASNSKNNLNSEPFDFFKIDSANKVPEPQSLTPKLQRSIKETNLINFSHDEKMKDIVIIKD